MTILLQANVRPLIIQEFGIWAKAHSRKGLHSEADGLLFFQYLNNYRADLLEFRHPGHDKWPVIRQWLNEAGLIAK